MVQVVFAGAWPEESKARVLRNVQAVLRDGLRLETDPAQYRLEMQAAHARGVAVLVQLFPAGSGRARRAVAAQLVRVLASTEALPATQISVSLDTPQQERTPG